MDSVELNVSDQLLSVAVELKWPSVPILKTAHLRGRLAKGLFSFRGIPLANNALMLHALVDYRDIAAVTTGEDGAFDFSAVPPGLYFFANTSHDRKT